jgi:Holliday junction resolvasome RuvABC endonuclease subunit
MIVGFDLSSRKLAAVSLDPVSSWTYEPPKKEKDRARVLKHFLDELVDLFEERRPRWVFIEHPLVGRGGAHATIVQAQVHGVVSAVAATYADGVYTVNVQSWKKEVVGNGRADKDRVRQWLEESHPHLAELAGADQDLVDAACVALYGRRVTERGSSLRLGP